MITIISVLLLLTTTGITGDLLINVTGEYLFSPSFNRHTMLITAQDRGGNFVIKTISFTTGYTDVKVVIKPEVLNINQGIITAYVKFPAQFGIPKRLEATLDGAPLEKWMISMKCLPEEGLFEPHQCCKHKHDSCPYTSQESSSLRDGTTQMRCGHRWDCFQEGPIVIIKFRRDDIEKALAQKGEILDTEFILKGTFTTCSGQLYDFEGSDSITKIIQKKPSKTECGSSQHINSEPAHQDNSEGKQNPPSQGGKKK
jgi:hypothetical protein